MQNNNIIETRFIPVTKGTPLPELFALRARAREELEDLRVRDKINRSSLAQRANAIRRKVYSRTALNAERKGQQANAIRALEIDQLSRAIISNCHQESLATIKAVCLSVFGHCPEIQKDLLAARLAQSFANLAASSLSRVLVAKGFAEALKNAATGLAQIDESEEVQAGAAILETRSGRIEINVMEDLIEAFSVLQKKLQESL